MPDIFGVIYQLNVQRADAKRKLDGIIRRGAAENRTKMTEAEEHETAVLFGEIREIDGKIAMAKQIRDEEAESDEASRDTHPTGAGTSGGRNYSLDSRTQFDSHGKVVSSTFGASVQRDESPEWIRTADGRPATVARGQRFADHESVRAEIARYADRDRHITEAHGDFGQYLRAMTTTGASAIVPTSWSADIIDLARNAAVVFNAGASLVPMDAKSVQVGRLTQDPAPAFKAEGDPVTAGDLAYDYITLTAASLAALVVVSVEFLQDAPNSSQLIQSALGKAMALQLDKVALFGQLGATGTDDEGSAYALASPNPKGLLKALVDYNSGSQIVGSFPANGTAQTAATPWDEMLSVVYKPLRGNERVSAIVSNVALEQQYAGMYDAYYNPIRKPEVIARLPWLTTNAIPSFTRGTMTSRATDVFAGDWSQLLIGQRLGLEIKVLNERYAENGQVGLLAYWRGDVQVARPGAFAAYRALQGAA